MRSKLTSLFVPVLICTLCCTLAIAAPFGTVRGRVSDPHGVAIGEARLLFHQDGSYRTKAGTKLSDTVSETDATGNFEVILSPGFYDVCIMATAFTPDCRKILVSKGDSVQHDVQLNVSPLVMEYPGDTF